MFGLIFVGASVAAAAYGYIQARVFTRKKLAFVDAAQTGAAPVLAGIGAAVLAGFVVAFLPWFGAGTALLIGAGVGVGVAGGQADIKHRRLNA